MYVKFYISFCMSSIIAKHLVLKIIRIKKPHRSALRISVFKNMNLRLFIVSYLFSASGVSTFKLFPTTVSCLSKLRLLQDPIIQGYAVLRTATNIVRLTIK